MPRADGPPPSDEFNIRLKKPFSGPSSLTISIIGSHNRPASLTRTVTTSNTNSNSSTGQIPSDDVNELLRILSPITGFPSDEGTDIFGLDTRLDLQTMQSSWSNAEADPAAESVDETVEEETKQNFRDVVKSVEAIAVQFAKQDAAV